MYNNSTDLEATNLFRVSINQVLCCENRVMKAHSLYLFKSRNNTKILFYYRISVNYGLGLDLDSSVCLADW